MASYNIVFREQPSNQVELFLQFIQTLDFVASVQKIEQESAKEEFMNMKDMKKTILTSGFYWEIRKRRMVKCWEVWFCVMERIRGIWRRTGVS